MHDGFKALSDKYGNVPDAEGSSFLNVDDVTIYGDQLIHLASVAGSVDDVRLLLELGADIDSSGEGGFTSLHYACEQGHLKLVKFLVVNGADRSVRNSDGVTPADLAILLDEPEAEEIIRLLS